MVTLRTKNGETRRPVQTVVAFELDEMQEFPHFACTPPSSVASSMSVEQLARYATPPNEKAGERERQAALPVQEQAAAAVDAGAGSAKQPRTKVAAGDESDWTDM